MTSLDRPAPDADDARTLRFRRASRSAFAAALLLPALATVLGAIPESRGAVITGTLLLPLLFGAMLANLLGWHRTMAEKSRIYLAVGLVFATWSAGEVFDALGEEHLESGPPRATAEAPEASGVEALPGALADRGHARVAQLALDGDRI